MFALVLLGSPGLRARGFLLCRRYSGRGGLGTLCARAALPQYGRDIIMESHHEQAQRAWDYRWSRVTECGALLASRSQKNVALSLDSADARVGRPLTATSVAGVNRRVHRRAYRRGYYYY